MRVSDHGAKAAPDGVVAWQLFLEAHGVLLLHLERALHAECGIPLTWYDLLVRLDHAPGRRLRMQDLVGSLMLTKSGISRLVDRMEAARLVTRQTCPSDGRGAFAVITDDGAAVLERATPVHRRAIQRHFGEHLDDDDLAALTALLTKLRATAPARPDSVGPAGSS